MSSEMINRLIRLVSGMGKPVSKSEWECQFKNGEWDYIKQLDELAHYSIIAGYFQYMKQGGSILDVGCGEGLLQMRLSPHAYSYYAGIDISEAAIERASSKGDDKTFFFTESVINYVPAELFDAIVFNETLYYFDNPLEISKKYTNYLKKDGIFIISMVKSIRSSFIWKKIEGEYITLDETKIINKQGLCWICRVLLTLEK